jgi:hypothetical protein
MFGLKFPFILAGNPIESQSARELKEGTQFARAL